MAGKKKNKETVEIKEEVVVTEETVETTETKDTGTAISY